MGLERQGGELLPSSGYVGSRNQWQWTVVVAMRIQRKEEELIKKHPVLCYESITVLVFYLNQYKGHTVNFILFNKRVNKH